MSGMRSIIKNRISYWPIFMALVCPLALVLAWADLFVGSLLLVPVVLLFWALASMVAALFAMKVCAESGLRRGWRQALSLSVLPVTAVTAALYFVSDAGQMTGAYVHLFVLYPRYAVEISDLSAPRFKAWQWDFPGPCGSGIAYDESDAVASRHRSTSDGFVGTTDVYGKSRAFGHFYFATFC